MDECIKGMGSKNHVQALFSSLENFRNCNYQDSWNQVNKFHKNNVFLSLLPSLPSYVKRQHAHSNNKHTLLPEVSALCYSKKSHSCTDDHSTKATGAGRKLPFRGFSVEGLLIVWTGEFKHQENR